MLAMVIWQRRQSRQVLLFSIFWTKLTKPSLAAKCNGLQALALTGRWLQPPPGTVHNWVSNNSKAHIFLNIDIIIIAGRPQIANCRLHREPTFLSESFCQRLNFQLGADLSANISPVAKNSKLLKFLTSLRFDSYKACIDDAFQMLPSYQVWRFFNTFDHNKQLPVFKFTLRVVTA